MNLDTEGNGALAILTASKLKKEYKKHISCKKLLLFLYVLFILWVNGSRRNKEI
jgi:hypothetical protein